MSLGKSWSTRGALRRRTFQKSVSSFPENLQVLPCSLLYQVIIVRFRVLFLQLRTISVENATVEGVSSFMYAMGDAKTKGDVQRIPLLWLYVKMCVRRQSTKYEMNDKLDKLNVDYY